MISKEDEKALEAQGWTIVCQSPLEIEYINPEYPQDGVVGFSSGVAASKLLTQLVKSLKKVKK